MLEKIITKLTVFALRHKKLTGEQKATVISVLLGNMNMFPITDVLRIDKSGRLLVHGKQLSIDQSISLNESGAALKASFARRLIHEQMKFRAITIGIHDGNNLEEIVFSKAVLYVIQEENALIDLFTGGSELSTDD